MALNFVRYKHARFSARFPDNFRYSPSHYWMAPVEGEPGVWRVGFTKFATRMLGELVDCEWQVTQGGAVESGQVVGWVEGFKAASDVYCVMNGAFEAGNPYLKQDACIVRTDPYERADITSNTYYDWFISQPYVIFAAQEVVGKFLATFKEYPPSQKASSFSIDQIVEGMQKSLNAISK